LEFFARYLQEGGVKVASNAIVGERATQPFGQKSLVKAAAARRIALDRGHC
jgi:non-canonical (house-cleaning) NTP pyrophosphatase